MRTEQEIRKKLENTRQLYWMCRQLGEKKSAQWYLAKFEAYSWVLGEDHSRLETGEMEARKQEVEEEKK